MTDYTIKQSGGDFSSINGFIGDGSVAGGDVGNIEGTWSVADTAGVTWNKAVTVKANDSSSKQIGRPWKTGDTTYRHIYAGSGHSFTCSANVDLRDITVHCDASDISSEIFRADSNYSTHNVKRCHLGFDNAGSQNDVVYLDSSGAPATITFEQCFFYDVERSIVDDYRSGESFTLNFNSCSSWNISSSGARNNGCWYGAAGSGSPTININAFPCLFGGLNDEHVFATDGGTPTLNVDAPYCISETTAANLSSGESSKDDTGTKFSHTWADSDQGAGDYVIMEDLTSAPYDPRLTDLGNSNNEAQDSHAVSTDAGLTIPSTDIVGTSRPQNTNYDVGIFEIDAGGEPETSGHPWFYRWQSSLLSIPMIAGLLMSNPTSSRRGFLKGIPFWGIRK